MFDVLTTIPSPKTQFPLSLLSITRQMSYKTLSPEHARSSTPKSSLLSSTSAPNHESKHSMIDPT